MQNGIPPEGWPPGYGPNQYPQNPNQYGNAQFPTATPMNGQNAMYMQQTGIPQQPVYSANNPFVNPNAGYTQQVVSTQPYSQTMTAPTGGYTQQGQYGYSNVPVASTQNMSTPTKGYDDYVDFGQMRNTPSGSSTQNYPSNPSTPSTNLSYSTPVSNTGGNKYDEEFFTDVNPRFHSTPVSPAPSQQVPLTGSGSVPGRTRAPSNPFRPSADTSSVTVVDASIVNNTTPNTAAVNKPVPIASRNTILRPLAKKPISVFATPEAFILRNSRSNNEDPLVIERKGANPGAFTRFKDKDKAPDTRVATFIDAYAVMGIINLDNEAFLILVTEATMIGSIRGAEIFCVTGTKFISFDYRKELDYSSGQFKPPYRSAKVQKFVEEGNMYFSYDYHLTHTVQRQEDLSAELQSKPVWKVADKRFFWNRYLMRHFIGKRLHEWIQVFTRGSFQIDQQHFMPETKEPFDLCLFTRNSCMRAGTRYNTRGVNDDGNVANFWETEQLVVMQDTLVSFVQIRGSVPIFWEEKVGSKLTITRPPDAAAPAFKKHMEELLKLYQSVHIVNLLTKGKSSEESVTQGYEEQLRRYKSDRVKYNYFDFHAECGKRDFSSIWNLIHRIQKDIETAGFYMWTTKAGKQHKTQRGIYRTNCLDCLDRTNVTQTAIARAALSMVVVEMGGEGHISEASRLGQAFNTMWANHGDVVSKVYAGTGAMKSSYTRKGKSTLAGLLDDATKSVTRLYHAKFSDENKQEAIDFFLGTIEDFQDDMDQTIEEKWVQAQLHARSREFTTIDKKRVFVGSYNVNAQVPPNKAFDLDVWFNPKVTDYNGVDIWIIGFQEIVDLGVGSVMTSSPSDYSRKVWEEVINYQLNLRRQKKLVMLRSEQLVGILLCVFVSEDMVDDIKNLHMENSKTGLYGLYGNKGALAVRFELNDSSFCFVCAHLSAGQNNVSDRISDIEGITSGTRFGISKTYGSTIMDNDYVFWLGDFNFRLNVPYFEALQRVNEKNWEYLKRYDQLRIAKSQGLIFRDFEEGNIDFAPTYKYDTGTDRYDTSDKQRVPAWTDRILYFVNKNNPHSRAELEWYGRCEMQFSDHRPMRGVFSVDVRSINREVVERLERELFKQAKTMDQKQLESAGSGPVDNKLADLAHLEVRQLPPQIGVNPGPPPLPIKGPLSATPTTGSTFSMPPPLPTKTTVDIAALQAKMSDIGFNPRPPGPVVRTTFDDEFGESMRGGSTGGPRPSATAVPTPQNFVPKPGRSPVGNEIDKYSTTISTVINEIQGAVGNVQTLMSSVNLLGSTLKALINYLTSLVLPDANQANKAKEFIQKATDTGQLLVASARMAVSDPSSALKHQQLMNNCYFLKDVIMLYSRYF